MNVLFFLALSVFVNYIQDPNINTDYHLKAYLKPICLFSLEFKIEGSQLEFKYAVANLEVNCYAN